jgi:putative solute:sodium symporter small subunit
MTSDPQPRRVRVTAPRSADASASRLPRPADRGPTSDIEGVYVRSLIRSQLRLGVVFALGFAVATVLFVLAIVLTPDLDESFVAGVPLSWLLLGAGIYPLAVTIGALYVRAAARNEERYRSLTEEE